MMEENKKIKSKYLIFCEAFLCKFFHTNVYISVESAAVVQEIFIEFIWSGMKTRRQPLLLTAMF